MPHDDVIKACHAEFHSMLETTITKKSVYTFVAAEHVRVCALRLCYSAAELTQAWNPRLSTKFCVRTRSEMGPYFKKKKKNALIPD